MPKEDSPPAVLPVAKAFTFGQVFVAPIEGGGFRLFHRDDANPMTAPEVFGDPEDALQIARTDDSGRYRPLKTAPNLRHGWQLELATVAELESALDYFYPGRLAILLARDEKRLKVTALRETLGRQSGMYRLAANISDDQLNELIGSFCRSDGGCLRTILWKRDVDGTIPSTKLPEKKFDPTFDQTLAGDNGRSGPVNLPLLCQEACNLLVAECRRVVKGGGE
jgi:sirohydrochlorin cobaltochelatase